MATQTQQRQNTGGTPAARNFGRISTAFPTSAVGVAGVTRPSGVGGPPGGILPGQLAAGDQAPLVATEVFNKVAILAALAIGAGALSFLLQVSLGLAMVTLVAGLVVGLVASFRPRTARTLAPIYALLEGFALGVLSRYYAQSTHGIVPMAIIFTGAVFVGTLAAYRTGLVRVTHHFIVGTMVLTFGLVAVLLAAFLGVPVPGVSSGGSTSSVVFGVIFLVVSVMNLFIDFEYVNRAQQAAAPAEAEWYCAFTIMTSLVMVYLSLLRILSRGR